MSSEGGRGHTGDKIMIFFTAAGPATVATNPFPLTEASSTATNGKNFHNSGGNNSSSSSSNPFVSEKFQESGPASISGAVGEAGATRRPGGPDSQPSSFQRFEI